MPIIDLQRRLREAGRIRIGDTVETQNGKSRPVKLESFRFTSSDRASIDAVAALYGGSVTAWDGGSGDQWQVTTTSTSLPVMLPPSSMAFSQFYEEWSGGGCVRRCDGATETISDKPCPCDPEARTCKPHTRLSLILKDLEGIGTWRLDTSGYYAATELGGSMELVEMLQQSGRMVAGRLVLTTRTVKRPGEGTKTFVVPGLDLNVNVAGMTEGPQKALGSPVTPVPTLDVVTPQVSDQISVMDTVKKVPKRSNSAPSLPSTGLKPGGSYKADDPKRPFVDIEKHFPEAEVVQEAEVIVQDAPAGDISKPQMNNILRLFKKADMEERDSRLAYTSNVIGRPIGSAKELSKREASQLIDTLKSDVGEENDKPKAVVSVDQGDGYPEF